MKIHGKYYRYIGVAIICLSLILIIAHAESNKTIDPDYLAKYTDYPSLYPLDEATYVSDWLGGIEYALVPVAIGFLVCAAGEVIMATGKEDDTTTQIPDNAPAPQPSPSLQRENDQ